MNTTNVELELADGQHVTLHMMAIDEEMLGSLWSWVTNFASMRYTLQDGTTVVRRRPSADVTGDLHVVGGTTKYSQGEPSFASEYPNTGNAIRKE